MHIRIYVANYSQFNVKSMFTTVYINRCCRQILLSRPCPFDQLELGNKVDMQTINYEKKIYSFTLLHRPVTFCIGRFDFFFQAVCF